MNIKEEQDKDLNLLRPFDIEKDKQELPKVLNKPDKFKVGDRVKVVRTLPIDYYGDKGWGIVGLK